MNSSPKTPLLLLCLGTLLLLGSCADLKASNNGWSNFHFRGCYDGDTCYFDFPELPPWLGQNLPIRLAHVDTPELRSRCPQENQLSLAAKAFTQKALTQASQIQLSQFSRGKYFRVIAQIKVDGRDLGEMLLSQGLARRYEGGAKGSWCGGQP